MKTEKHRVTITTEDGLVEATGFLAGVTVKEIEDVLRDLGMTADEEDWFELNR